MNWLALNAYEVAALWSAGAALAFWLYLHARVPSRRRVSTLYFWASVLSTSRQSRRRIRDSWALLAQLIFLLLLILALANLRWGAASEGRRVAIVLDTSIWSQQQAAGGTTVISTIQDEALRILNALPPGDSVLLLSAEPGAPPILPFTTDRAVLRDAILATKGSDSVADIPRALKIGQNSVAASRQALLVYVGPGMIGEEQVHDVDQIRASMEGAGATGPHIQFLVRLVGDSSPVDNRGITRLSVKRDTAQPDRWHLLTQVKNYAKRPARVTLTLSVNGRSFAKQPIALRPEEMVNVQNDFVWAPGGPLQAEISPADSLEVDNQAVINIPEFRPLRVAIYSPEAGLASALHGALDNNPLWAPEFLARGSDPKSPPDIAIYQETTVPAHPVFNSIYFMAGGSVPGSPPLRINEWNAHHPVTRWIHTRDVAVRNPVSLPLLLNDTVLASYGTPAVPLIIARESEGRRLVLIGFNPRDTNLLQERAFPLLIAGSMEWLTHSLDDLPASLHVGEIDLPGPVARIFAPLGNEVPFDRMGDEVHLIANETGLYRIITPNGESSVAVNAPLLPAHRWDIAPGEGTAPEPEPRQQPELYLWRWLLALALIPLWLEWWSYYSGATRRRLGQAGNADDGILTQDRDPVSGRNRERPQAPDAGMVA